MTSLETFPDFTERHFFLTLDLRTIGKEFLIVDKKMGNFKSNFTYRLNNTIHILSHELTSCGLRVTLTTTPPTSTGPFRMVIICSMKCV